MNIIEKLKKNVEINPDKIAIHDDKYSFTYRNVDIISTEIANKINENVSQNGVVALDLNHTYIIVLTILGVLKAGCTYVPLNKRNSMERNRHILKITKSEIILTDDGGKFEKERTLVLSDVVIGMMMGGEGKLSQLRSFPDFPYILFTSGSTGEPKGVRVTKENLNYILENMQNICPGDKNSVFCLTTPYTFDVAATEIFGWIAANASVFTFDINNFKMYKVLLKKIGQFHISHFGSSPSLLNTLFDISNEEDIQIISQNIKYLIVAGEEMPVRLVERWRNYGIQSKLYNFYGPTEATVYATYYEIPRNFSSSSVPIGRSLNGASFLIENADEQGKGELVITGKGITDGYINNQDLNEKNFGHMHNGERYYRTGDIVRVNGNGELIFYGRNDDQIELNGIRVELGEIDYYVARLPEIKEVKTLQNNGVLVSFFVGISENLNLDSLRHKLKNMMPSYMVPNVFFQLDSLPLNINKKIDKQELLRLFMLSRDSKNSTEDSFDSETEGICEDILESTVKIFRDTLGTEIDLDDDFFEFGGDSLNVVSYAIQMEEKLGIVIEMDTFYLYRTPRKIVKYLQSRKKSNFNPPALFKNVGEVNIVPPKLGKEIGCTTASYTQRLYYYKKKNNIITFTIEVPLNSSIIYIKEAVEEVLKNNPILRTSFHDEKDKLMLFTHAEVHFSPSCVYKFQQKSIVIDQLIKQIFDMRYQEGALLNYAILKDVNRQEIIFAIDHCIFDASSVSIFKNEFSKSLLGERICKVGITYFDFYHKLEKENSVAKVLNHPYMSELNKSNKCCENVVSRISKGMSHVVIKNVNLFDGTELSYLISYISCKQISLLFNLKSVTSNLILNLRNFKSFSLSDTIGDVHSTIQLIYAKESYTEYLKKSIKVVDEVFMNELFNPRTVAYIDYPKFSIEQKSIRKIIGNDVPISISFVGSINESELEGYQDSITLMQKELDKSADLSRIYATAVLCRDNLHIFYDHKVFGNQRSFDFTDIK